MESLKKAFNWVAKGAFYAICIFAMTEMLTFTLLHYNPAWMAVMHGVSPTINAGFDATGITDAGWWLAEKLGSGAETMAKSIGGVLTPSPTGGMMMLPA